MEFRVLGPLEVWADGVLLSLGGPRQRALIAILLLNANRVVSRDRLLDELWGAEASTAGHALNVAVARLRKALGADGGEARLVSRTPGYVLRVEPGELDLEVFERHVHEGRRAAEAGDHERAAGSLREADALWRGRPLADLEFEPFARVEVERLGELRLAAVEDRIDAELVLGRLGELVPELEALIAEHPLRERLRAQLMRALYANARQADALAVYSQARKLLVEELGIEPSEELRELERKILNQDPELRIPIASASSSQTPATDARPGEQHERRRVSPYSRLSLVAGAALVVAAVATILAVGHSHGAPARALIRSDAVAFLDARSGKLIGQVAVGPAEGYIRFGERSAWKLEPSGELLQIDPRRLRLTRSIATGIDHGAIAIGEGGVWVAGQSTLARIDPNYGTVAERVRLSTKGLSRQSIGGAVAPGAGSLWVAQGLSRVVRLDPASGRVEHRFTIAGANVIAFGDGALWVASSELGTVTKIDPRTNTIAATARVGPSICCLAVGGGYAWAANDTGIWKLSPTGDPVATTKLPNEAGDIAYGGDALWVGTADTAMRIDAETGAVRRYPMGHPVNGIGTDGRRVAVSVFANPADLTAHVHGHVLRVAFSAIWFDATDPAVAAVPGEKNWATEQQLQFATCARLLNHPDAPAPRNSRLVPEVAAAPPTVSPDGRTYTFRIRPGFRFSPPSNEPVTAPTFKYSIERALSSRLGGDAPAVPLASDIVGVNAYRAGAARHISGIKARRDILAITLARRAPDFPERIATSYFCPVPIGTPTVAHGLEDPIPSAGPYYLSGNQGGSVAVLKRNPNYHGRRPHRLDAIIFREEIPLANTVHRIAAGEMDYAAEQGPALAPETPLARRFGRAAPGRQPHYVRTPLLGTDELVFDSRHGLFADTRVRRAVSFALDRPALAAALGDLAADRYLPPGMPGFAKRRVYPLDGPNPSRARALMRGRTAAVVLAVCGEPNCTEAGHVIRANLRRIGIRVSLHRYAGDIASRTHRVGADIVLTRVYARYPDPVAFLRTALGAAAPRKRLDRLAQLDRPRRLAAAGRLELELLRQQAPIAAFGTPAIPEFFSARVGCTTFAPASFGVDLAALCLRNG